jgi:hypothetical protein
LKEESEGSKSGPERAFAFVEFAMVSLNIEDEVSNL